MRGMVCIPEYAANNILQLHDERVARYLTDRDLSEITGVAINRLRAFEQLRSWPSQISYNRLARYFGWKLWE